jgi:hypothetical protein
LHPVFEPPGTGAAELPDYREASLPRTDPPPRGEILSQRMEAGLGIAELSAARATHLLFKVTHHPGWRAQLDDHPAEILRVAPGFMAVAVAAGRHTVRFDYQPPHWRRPLLVAGWALLLGLPYLERRRGSRRGPVTIDADSVTVTRS